MIRLLLKHRGLGALLVLVFATVFCYLFFLNPVPDFYPEQQNDPFEYLSFSKSLLAGQGYPTKHWMPGFPALLAVWIAIFGQDYTLLKLCMVATAFSLVMTCYVYFKMRLQWTDAAWLSLFVAVVPAIFSNSHRLMSEIPSAALIMLVLAMAESYREHATSWSRKRKAAHLVVFWCACAASVMVRGNALALVPALLAASINWPRPSGNRIRRINLPLAVGACLIALAFGLWSVRNRSVEYSGINNVTYLEEVRATNIEELWKAGSLTPGVERADARELIRRVSHNILWHITYNVADCLFPGARILSEIRTPGLGLAVAALLSIPVVSGIVPLFRKSVAGGVYLLFSLVMLIVYPTGGAERMLVPSIPLIILAGFLGIRFLLGRQMARGWAFATVCFGLINCVATGQAQHEHPYSFDEFADFVTVLEHANQQFPNTSLTLVSHRSDAVSALTRFTPCEKYIPGNLNTLKSSAGLSISSALDSLHRGDTVAFLVVEFEEFRPISSLPADVSCTLLKEKGKAKLWKVALRQSDRP